MSDENDGLEGSVAPRRTIDRQTIETMNEVIHIDKASEERPTLAFFLRKTRQYINDKGVPEVDVEVVSYLDWARLSILTQFRVRAELQIPIRCKIQWLSPGDGGLERKPESGYVAVACFGWYRANVVLCWNDDYPPGKPVEGIALSDPSDEGYKLLVPGSVLELRDGSNVVAKVVLDKGFWGTSEAN